ncbi:MAG TPA: hypothetical protein VGL57_08175 [Solirubrobacteraceae bacterium]|jgi:hypothetical protein
MIARWSQLRTLIVLCGALGAPLLLGAAPALAQREHVFAGSFGSATSTQANPEPLSNPGWPAVEESTGVVYVADRGHGRVEMFESSGKYLGQFDGSASPTGAFQWEERAGLIAVDNSANVLDPSKGDVYVVDYGHRVVDKFSATGAYIGDVTSASFAGSSEINGVAVDSEGELWVQIGTVFPTILRFSDALANEYQSSVQPKVRAEGGSSADEISVGKTGIALDTEDNFYLGITHDIFEAVTYVTKFSATGEELDERLDSESPSGVAVDPSSNDVYVDHGTSIAAYQPSGSPVESFGSEELQASEGVAVDAATGTVYAANASTQEIDVFTAFVVPDASTGSVSSFAETAVTVTGTVDPDGLPIAACEFEYGTSTEYGQTAPCSPTPGSGSSPVAVSAELKGLEPLTRYHFRLKASNANGSNQGLDRVFTTPEPVAISDESVSDISANGALFNAQVDPGGAATTYHFEYGTSVSYGESVPVPAGELGGGTSAESVSVRVQGLLAETTYHARLVASNVLGTVRGPDETFTTQTSGGTFMLPDGRQWEMASPSNKEGALIQPIGGGPDFGGLIQASAEGNGIGYYATAPVGSGVRGNSDPLSVTEVLSMRHAGGWSSEDVTPPNQKALSKLVGLEYRYFSSDLSHAIVEPLSDFPLLPNLPGRTPYLRDDNSEGYVSLAAHRGEPESEENEITTRVVGATPDLSHVLLGSPYALTENAVQKSLPSGPVGNLYEWSEGKLQLINLVSEFGRLGNQNGQNTRNAVSSDGSRVFFSTITEPESGPLYMRDTATAQTVQVDAPAPGVKVPPAEKSEFQIASADGSEVFFTDQEPLTLDSKLEPVETNTNGPSDLYVYDTVTGGLTDLSIDQNAGEAANVQSEVVGASEDGSVVYFVATGKLASGAQSGMDNLYVESKTGSAWSPARLVAVLSSEEAGDWSGRDAGEKQYLTSRVSSSGRYLAFMSARSLTGYDNHDASSGEPDQEVFLYDATTGKLRCVSCNPTGARPNGVFDEGATPGHQLVADADGIWQGHWLAGNIPGWTLVEERLSLGVGYQSRVLADDGRMFFDSSDGLVSQDTNDAEDVYEYEPQGIGSCTSAGGCVSLISSGTSAEGSAFLDASGKGPGGGEAEDVFFLTAARLVSGDVDSSYDVYDAHVCSTAVPCMSAPVSPPPCTTSDGCKAAPSPQPAIFGPPPSATFSGAGNVAQPVSGQGSSHRKLTRAQKRAAALKACTKQPKRKRATCDLRARKRYGMAKPTAKKSLAGKGRR